MQADKLNNAALEAVKECNYKEAESLFNKALTLDPFHIETIYNYGLMRWRRGLHDSAKIIIDLSDRFKDDTSNSKIPYLIGCIERESLNFRNAMENFLEAKRLGYSASNLEQQIMEIKNQPDTDRNLVFEYKFNYRDIDHESPVSCRAGKVAFISQDGCLFVMDANDGQRISIAELETSNVRDIAISPDGKLIALIDEYRLYFWNLEEKVAFGERPRDKVKYITMSWRIRHPKLTFSPDGKRIFCCGYGETYMVDRMPYAVDYANLCTIEYDITSKKLLYGEWVDKIPESHTTGTNVIAYSYTSEERIWINTTYYHDDINIGIFNDNRAFRWIISNAMGRKLPFRSELIYSSDVDYAIFLPRYSRSTRLILFRGSSGELVAEIPSFRCHVKDGLILSIIEDNEKKIRATCAAPIVIKKAPWCSCEVLHSII